MKAAEIAQLLEAEVYTGKDQLEMELLTAFSGDMMSDVLAFPKENMVLLTGLLNTQVMRTCEMLDIHCVVFVRGKKPSDDILEMAEENEILVMSTRNGMYVSSGILYSNGLNAIKRGI
ncbi:MAG: hypothetical protein IJB41_01175 [Clostridia bacterium]|nr:hypothetical protein [Clostridia bacterium]